MRIKAQLPRVYRLAVLVAIVWLVHIQHQRMRAQRVSGLEVEQVTQFFPAAASLGERTPPYNLQKVSDSDDRTLGLVLRTSPEADWIRGYSGPSDVLVALDPTGRVTGAGVLSSEDTRDHVQAVIEDPAFWKGFHGLALGAPGRPEIDAVSGSTLTSEAIVRAVVDRLGGVAASSLFPTEILLAEARLFLPQAERLEAHPEWDGVMSIYDKSSNKIGHALRTAPSQDTLIGYQGPSDVLVLLDAEGATVTGLRLRKTYDNDDYTERVTDDADYLALYNGWTVEEVAEVDFRERGIEGVSGATLTSWAVAESVKRRLAAFLAVRDATPPPPLLSGRDLLLLFVTLGGLLMAFTKLRGRRWLRLAWQVVLVVVLGFLTGDLLSQALLAGWAQNGVAWRSAIGILVLAGAAFVIPWTTGKQLYCHHLCPHGAVQQWLQKIPVRNRKVGPRLHRVLSALPFVLLALVLASVLLGLGINLAAIEAFDAWLFRVAGWASITIALVGLIASVFVPLAYCKYGCPTGLLLKFIRWRGASDRFDRRDALAGGLLAIALAIVLL